MAKARSGRFASTSPTCCRSAWLTCLQKLVRTTRQASNGQECVMMVTCVWAAGDSHAAPVGTDLHREQWQVSLEDENNSVPQQMPPISPRDSLVTPCSDAPQCGQATTGAGHAANVSPGKVLITAFCCEHQAPARSLLYFAAARTCEGKTRSPRTASDASLTHLAPARPGLQVQHPHGHLGAGGLPATGAAAVCGACGRHDNQPAARFRQCLRQCALVLHCQLG